LSATAKKNERIANAKLNKQLMQSQAQGTMERLWTDARSAEAGIEAGEPGALDLFVDAAGTMIETYRLARGNFGKNRVGPSGDQLIIGYLESSQKQKRWRWQGLDVAGVGHAGKAGEDTRV
jgi:hypothetical protein